MNEVKTRWVLDYDWNGNGFKNSPIQILHPTEQGWEVMDAQCNNCDNAIYYLVKMRNYESYIDTAWN